MELQGVACRTTVDCETVGFDDLNASPVAYGTTDGGSSWQGQTLPVTSGNLEGVACSTSSDCEAVGFSYSSRPLVLGTTDGGSSWQSQSVR